MHAGIVSVTDVMALLPLLRAGIDEQLGVLGTTENLWLPVSMT